MSDVVDPKKPGDRIKRALDIAVALPALIVAAPVAAVVAAAVRIALGTPILFRQTRPGLGARPFVMYKFRTMREPRPGERREHSDAARLTPLGRFLRRTSLDELPELWNVLRGDMSLVGPRPLLMQYVPFFSERERLRFTVRPGITGWAQISGRNALSWDDRLARDVWYVEHRSIALDLAILVRTVAVVLRAEGAIVHPRSVMLNLDEERAKRASATRNGMAH